MLCKYSCHRPWGTRTCVWSLFPACTLVCWSGTESLSSSRCAYLVVQSLSRVRFFATPWTVASQASLSFSISQSLLKLMSTQSMMPSNHLIHCCPFLLLPLVFFPSIRVFSNDLALHIRWPEYWSFSITPSNEYSGLISFRIDWFDLLAVRGTHSRESSLAS